MKIILEDRFIDPEPELFDIKSGHNPHYLKSALSSVYGWIKDRGLNNFYFYPMDSDDAGIYGIGVELNIYGYIWLSQFNSVPYGNIIPPIQSIHHYNKKPGEKWGGKVSHRWGGQLVLTDEDGLTQELHVPNHQEECIEAIKKYWKNSAFVDVFLTHAFPRV